MILPFELDPQIIHHIIYSQAGSIGKALIELLMNSVDAGAATVRLDMTKEGFACVDDGGGFASREDVVRYFGVFGTPHEEGDAVYGRFRLGRGQIMAHASTVWTSNRWRMAVDTRTMGYSYDLGDLEAGSPGCRIDGTWYEPLTEAELMSAAQEIRDLVRYTPVAIVLNGRAITRDPRNEKWDFEDEYAYYRVKAEGAVSIYNQGVLVRHDSSHLWGAGGLIVTKLAIGLNVSRTEILRKTCPVWKPVAKQFGRMADEIAARLGEHRKTEARREKFARALLDGGPDILRIYKKEEVVTLLPGKRHVTLNDFLIKTHWHSKGKCSIVENGFDVPKGEAVVRAGIIQAVHPQTLSRFGCHATEDFRETLERILESVRDAGGGARPWEARTLEMPDFVDFVTILASFFERTRIVTEKDALDKEARRAWVALRWCVQQYVGACLGGRRYSNGQVVCRDGHVTRILLGDSNTAEAWTDGKTYIAINQRVVKRMKDDPVKTAAYVFGLVDHEIAHLGDSLEEGHDEAFYQRYHDISIRMAAERQAYIHAWLMKYTASMEGEDRRKRMTDRKAWGERLLVDRAGTGRRKRGLPEAIGRAPADLVAAPVPAEDIAFIDAVNSRLVLAGLCPPPPDWDEVIERARQAQAKVAAGQRKEAARRAAEESGQDWERRYQEDWERGNREARRRRYAAVVGVEPSGMPDEAVEYIWIFEGETDDRIREIWESRKWEADACEPPCGRDTEEEEDDPRACLPENLHPLLQDGETWWGLKRNAAAAGFWQVDEYLRWRSAG